MFQLGLGSQVGLWFETRVSPRVCEGLGEERGGYIFKGKRLA